MLWEKMNAKQVLSCYKLMKTSVMLRRFLSVLVLLPVLAMAQPAAPSASSKADATANFDAGQMAILNFALNGLSRASKLVRHFSLTQEPAR